MTTSEKDKRAEREEQHPSYGMLGFSRVSSTGTHLFGSALDDHHTHIELTLMSGSVRHDLGREWYSGDDILFKVALSPAQFTEMLTSMNVGSGVPCTIEFNHGHVSPPPKRLRTHERIAKDFENDLKPTLGKIREERATVEHLTKGLSAKAKADIGRSFDQIEQHIRSNWPFALTSFREAATKVATAVKAEVDAFITHAIMVAGVDAIAAKRLAKGQEVVRLPPPEEK